MALLSTPDVCSKTGLTYRQLIYWVEQGAVTPTRPSAGSGHYIGWSEHDVMCLTTIASFVAALEPLVVNILTSTVWRIWTDLNRQGFCELASGSVTIRVEIPW